MVASNIALFIELKVVFCIKSSGIRYSGKLSIDYYQTRYIPAIDVMVERENRSFPTLSIVGVLAVPFPISHVSIVVNAQLLNCINIVT